MTVFQRPTSQLSVCQCQPVCSPFVPASASLGGALWSSSGASNVVSVLSRARVFITESFIFVLRYTGRQVYLVTTNRSYLHLGYTVSTQRVPPTCFLLPWEAVLQFQMFDSGILSYRGDFSSSASETVAVSSTG